MDLLDIYFDLFICILFTDVNVYLCLTLLDRRYRQFAFLLLYLQRNTVSHSDSFKYTFQDKLHAENIGNIVFFPTQAKKPELEH